MKDEERLIFVLNRQSKEQLNKFFEYIYYKYKGLVCFVAGKYIKNDDDIKDVVQDVFLNFFNNINNVNNNIKSYLCVTTKNVSLNLLNKKNNVTSNEFNNIVYESNYKFIKLTNSIDSVLNEIERKIFYYHNIEGYLFNEIATLLNTNENSIKTTYYRSLKKIKEVL